MTRVAFEVNGTPYAADVEPRLLLVDVLRDHLHLTGTHIGCEHGVCGTCTVQIDGKPARSCITLAVQADGSAIRTVEGLAPPGGDPLHPLQNAFHEHHALQCGYCTPGFLMSIEALLPELGGLSDGEMREQLAGNLCRCTGYQNIVEATKAAISELEDGRAGHPLRRADMEHAVPLVEGRSGVWAAMANPEHLLAGLGVAGVVACGPTAWRGHLVLDGAKIGGIVDLLDLDDDRHVANFELQAREADGPGQVRGTLRLSLDASTLAIRVGLEFIGTSVAPDHDVLQTRLRAATAAWAETLGEPAATEPSQQPTITRQRRRSPAPWNLVAVTAAAWLIWRAHKSRR